MSEQPVVRDERTTAVENASYRLAYTVLSFGALVIVAWRALFLRQPLWDLIALVCLTSVLATAYQAVHNIFTRRVVVLMVILMVLSFLIAAVLVLLIAR
ncbi:MAG: hypothetical protein N2508_08430 [Anaerolineae bacterium]|nr:hypothetical protein [Anaerolineae bacterium]